MMSPLVLEEEFWNIRTLIECPRSFGGLYIPNEEYTEYYYCHSDHCNDYWFESSEFAKEIILHDSLVMGIFSFLKQSWDIVPEPGDVPILFFGGM